MRFFILLLFFSCFMLHATEPDSLKRRMPKLDLESLSVDSFIVESDIENMSSGWFPRIAHFRSIELVGADGLILHDGIFHQSASIPGSILGISGFTFTSGSQYSLDDRIPLQPFSMNESGDDVIEQEYAMNYLRTRFSLPQLGFLLRIGLGIRFVNNMLFAVDESKSYLNPQQSLSPLHELHTISINETELMSHCSLELPLYGASIDLLGQQTYSHYSLFGGMNLHYVLESSFMHQSIIVKGAQEIRYPSGSNILTLEQRSFMNEIQRLRISIETGLGWHFGFGPLHLGIEGFMLIPTNSILKGHDWNILTMGLRSSIGISF